MQNRTSIIIAHRMSTIEKCDKIFVLEDGKVRPIRELVDIERVRAPGPAGAGPIRDDAVGSEVHAVGRVVCGGCRWGLSVRVLSRPIGFGIPIAVLLPAEAVSRHRRSQPRRCVGGGKGRGHGASGDRLPTVTYSDR